MQFSRDPMNLVNQHARKHEGFVNDKAIGIQPDSNTVRNEPQPPREQFPPTHVKTVANRTFSSLSKQIKMTTKLPSRVNKPAAMYQESSFSASTPPRKLSKNVVNSTAKKGYRADLRAEAVARASAIKYSQREKKDTPASKPRGARARKAAEKASA